MGVSGGTGGVEVGEVGVLGSGVLIGDGIGVVGVECELG